MSGERDRKSRLKGIEDQRKGTLDALNDEQAKREKMRQDALADDLKKNEDALRKAREELAKAIAKAGKKNKKADEADEKKLDKDKKRIEIGGKKSQENKTAIEGTVTGFDRFASGRKRPEEKMIRALEKIQKNTAGLPRLRALPNL
jgi:hypothetical protein